MASCFLGESRVFTRKKERKKKLQGKRMGCRVVCGLGHLKGRGPVGHLSVPSLSNLLGRKEAMKGPFLWPYLLENNEQRFPADSPRRNKYPSVGL